jgi:hypothetical protein
MIRRGCIHRTSQGKAQAAGCTEPADNVLLTNNRCQIGLADPVYFLFALKPSTIFVICSTTALSFKMLR